ncbi:MAG: methyl-accepting chemotaxis protein, partial [Lachnospiraceae bacterium]|nr:methyl-accepting chemotaxis protein [Lachnospiraceae bacterium]
MSKNMKIRTQLIIGFTIIELLVIALLYTSYTTAATIITLPTERQKSYLSSYATFSAVLFIVMIIVITGIAVVMIKKITTNLKELQDAAGAMAKGQIDIAVDKKNNDEFGELIDDVGQLVKGIAVQTEVAKQVAEGNLTVEVTPRSDVDVMGIALKQMVVKNRKTLGNIKEAAYQVTTSSSQVASASEALAQGSTEQASAIEEITASIDDVAEKTKQNASQANEAAVMMSKTITKVKKGNEEMEQMVVAMKEINESSENISKIIKVIDDIAFQTNILALNAAVEAARAGDAGKGFAVVAEEVRNLAAKSAAAAA